MHRRTILALILTTVLTVPPLFAPVCRAAANPAREYMVKAALVFNFARFTDWTDAGYDDVILTLCVFEDAGMREAFETIDGRRLGDREIQVRFITDAHEVDDCHLLFVPGADRERWQKVRHTLADRPVLTVGEMNGFLESGGIMNLSLVDGRIGFQVNLAEAKRRGLTISSRILKLASEIVEVER